MARTSIPPRLRGLTENLPSSREIRERLDETRRESAFLRKMLKLARDAESVNGD